MRRRGGRGRIARALGVAIAGLALSAPAASAVGGFHFIKIREVSLGTGDPSAAFVELQSYSSGQSNIAGHTITFYDETGIIVGTYPVSADVPNGDSQRTVLMGGPGVSPAPDFVHDFGPVTQSYGSGGALCFDNLDCVSWGSFSAPGSLPSPAGANAPPIPAGSSLERSIGAGCATLLEELDDTDISASDWSVSTPSPRNNAATPTERSCLPPGAEPETRIDEGPKKKTKRKKAVFEFSTLLVGATFECSLDGKAPSGSGGYGACTSPLTARVKRGKHVFRVRAVLNGIADGSPAQHSWKVRRPRG
jgi:hypothetical protein